MKKKILVLFVMVISLKGFASQQTDPVSNCHAGKIYAKSFGEDKKGRRTIIVKSPTGMASEYTIPHGKHPNVYKNDRVFAGQQLTDGPVVPHDILKVCGDQFLI